ncbi:MAG: S41 family peptidase [Flavobacteriaceae bacterium]
MKKTRLFLLLMILTALAIGCEVQDDNEVPKEIEVQNFVWKGLNLYYLWQKDVPDLADNRFANQSDLNSFLSQYSDPKVLFQNLLNKPVSQYPTPGEAIDRFSVIFSDYTQLEGILSGTTLNNGAEIGLYYKDNTQTAVFGVVRYVLAGSDAALKNVRRGDIFYAIDGTELNASNYRTLLAPNSYTLNLANYDGGNITPSGQSVLLTKSVISENPVHITSVIESGAHRIGYLMYNGFYPNYESTLNQAFAQLKSAGITELVLDLRYNSGGSIATATRLASMITGQFNGQVFAKEQWNAKVESYYNSHGWSNQFYNRFTTTLDNSEIIQSSRLNKIWILTSKATASASELVINGLKPYIQVNQIGDWTVGKNVGSITLYDSPNFSKTGINSHHRYAMQPLVLKIVNKDGFGDYINGLEPDIQYKENLGQMGILGQADEPLLQKAIQNITGAGRLISIPSGNHKAVKDQRIEVQLQSEMYKDNFKIP